MLGRRGMAAGVELVKMNDNSARAPGENPNSAAPDSNARMSVRREQLKQVDFIVNLDFGKAGAFKAILFGGGLNNGAHLNFCAGCHLALINTLL